MVEDVSQQIEGRFKEFFRTATYDSNSAQGHDPYPFQTRLATTKELPELIDIPTGLGKTDAVVLAWLWRRRVFRCNLTERGKIELVAALTEIIKHDDDRIMIVDLGPLDGRVEERIEFLGVHPTETESKAVVV